MFILKYTKISVFTITQFTNQIKIVFTMAMLIHIEFSVHLALQYGNSIPAPNNKKDENYLHGIKYFAALLLLLLTSCHWGASR